MSIQLYQGDCLELMKNIPDQSVDMILTDPPATLFPESTYRVRSPKKQNKVSQAKRRKYKRQGQK